VKILRTSQEIKDDDSFARKDQEPLKIIQKRSRKDEQKEACKKLLEIHE
jgi:hypothetical protein